MAEQTTTLPRLEESLTEISQLIDKMEQGELTLEQSLVHFERGVTLIKHCQKILAEAEQKVQILVQNNNQETLIPYGDDNKQPTVPGNESDE
jgi:exodeoxyribonuclease VII small subunit